MTTSRSSAGYHILALATILVWGTTFTSTKVLLTHGLTPPEIMLYRFLIAYALTWFCSYKVWADTWIDELLLAVAGFTGGTLYFLAENTAIDYPITSNVALVVCITPVLTALLTSLIYRERITGRLAIGSAVALLGVGLVVLNGAVLKIHPLGDTLALIAALAWADAYVEELKNGTVNVENIKSKVFDSLEKNNVDTGKYSINVTEKGVEVLEKNVENDEHTLGGLIKDPTTDYGK